METKTPARDAIYARYSSTNQDRGVSIEVQLEACRQVADASAGPPLEFVDRAVTGVTMARDSFRAMLQAAERHEFGRLIVYKWDRFGRNAETHATVADLEDLGIKVLSATEGDDFLARGVGLVVSEDYSRKLSERVAAAMRVRFKQGAFLGARFVPFGYQAVRDEAKGFSRLVVVPEEAKVIRLMFRLYVSETIGAKRLAQKLNKLGHRSRAWGLWSWCTIAKILRNPLYVGRPVYGRAHDRTDRRTGRTHRIYLPADRHVTFHDEALRIVDDKTYNRAADRMRLVASGRNYRAVRSGRTLTGLAFCPECGSVMYCVSTRPDRKTVYRYLTCGRHHRLGDDGCKNARRAREDTLLALIQHGFRKVLANKEMIVRQALAFAQQALADDDGGRAKLEQQTNLGRVIGRFTNLMMDPSLADEQVKAALHQLGEAQKRREEVHAALLVLGNQAGVDAKAVVQEVEAAFAVAREDILKMKVATPERINRAIQRFCGPIYVYPDGSISPQRTGEAPSMRTPPSANTGDVTVRAAFWSAVQDRAA